MLLAAIRAAIIVWRLYGTEDPEDDEEPEH
jgi:hypothetical protein